MESSLSENPDEYSASSTVITFDRPIPLIRGPVRAGTADDATASPYVLAFRDHQAWKAAYRATESKIIEQCEAGARIGCAISASSKCKPPWWQAMVGWKKGLLDPKHREICEEREMEGCLVAAKEKCVGFAKDKCSKPFSDARVATSEKKAGEMGMLGINGG